ncbi:MAG: hypothetical protein WDN69_00955 [Aliidongia sp.]
MAPIWKSCPNRKLVFTDAYIGDWMPRTDGKPFMTAIINLRG